MLKRIDYKNQPKSIPLSKGQSVYNQLQKEMNETAKEYNAIKSLVETNENDIKHIDIKPSKNIKLIPHQKKT